MIVEWSPHVIGPGVKRLDEVKRNPYDIATWGSECGRGIQYKDLGTQITGQQNEHKISGGRKKRK